MFKKKSKDINADERDYIFIKNKDIYTRIFHDQVREIDNKVYVVGFEELTTILKKLKGYERISSGEIGGIHPVVVTSFDIEDRLDFIKESTKHILGITEEDNWKVFFNTKGLFIPSFGDEVELRMRRYSLSDRYISSILNDFIKKTTYIDDAYIINLKNTGISIAKKYNFTVDAEEPRIVLKSNFDTKEFLRACMQEKGIYREMYVQDGNLYVVL